jgi:uncharacterized protein (TIGR00369 family)
MGGMTDSARVPEGFTAMRPYGKFHELVGPLFMARRGDKVVVGLQVEERHENAVGSLHGGMTMALVDTALTLAAARAAPKGQYAITQGITADFLAPARAGDWIEAEVEVLRAGRTTITLDCRVRRDGVDGKLLLRASGTFHVVSGS